MSHNAAEPRAGKREWTGLAVLAFPCFLLALDFTVLHLAVPKITADLAPSSTQTPWIVDIYGFFIASSLLTMGTLGDRIGRRKLLMIGGGAFGAASTVAAFAGSASTLIITRALLGARGRDADAVYDGAHPQHVSRPRSAARRDRNLDQLLRRRRRDRAAPWRRDARAFLVGLGVPAERARNDRAARSAPILLPEFKDPAAGKIDIASAALSLTSILSVIYGIKRMAQDGPGFVPLLQSHLVSCLERYSYSGNGRWRIR